MHQPTQGSMWWLRVFVRLGGITPAQERTTTLAITSWLQTVNPLVSNCLVFSLLTISSQVTVSP